MSKKSKASTKDLKTIDDCRKNMTRLIPKSMDKFCKDCGCYAYCHRQLTLWDFMEE